MAIGIFESQVLTLIGQNRNPESFVAGATVINQHPLSLRTSDDVDLFHDTEAAFERDAEVLQQAGFKVQVLRRFEKFIGAIVSKGDVSTKLEWVFDSAFRFFPIEPDPALGYRLSQWDAATNKLLAMAGRSKIRDLYDVLFLHDNVMCLSALAWAAAGKDPGLTPESILDWATRNAVYRNEDLAELKVSEPISLVELKSSWLSVCAEATGFIKKVPPKYYGCFFLNSMQMPYWPSEYAFLHEELHPHYGSLRGAWPRVAE